MTIAPDLLAKAEAARGFMPPDEGLALYEAAAAVAVDGPLLEVGSYCGKSAVYLGAAAREWPTLRRSSDSMPRATLVALPPLRGSE